MDACNGTSGITLVHLSDAETAERKQTNNHTDLIQSTATGLLRPSVPLSRAAVSKLQQQQQQPADHLNARPAAGQLLRSLPVELLYDDAGLQLFDQITYLPEYYLTAAEADIFAIYGTDIVQNCMNDGSPLIELGAGSMRKTRLLLEAVLACGYEGVTFCALDLCENSLRKALEQLQGVFQNRINLTGLVGTYQQGLAYIQRQTEQQYKQQQLLCMGSSIDSKCSMVSTLDSYGNGALHTADAPAGEEDALTTMHVSADNGGSSPVVLRQISTTSLSCSSDSPAGSQSQTGNGQRQAAEKVIMWLGSSIGNYGRDEAAAFLKQLRDEAMEPGDKLLVGIDRRNPAAQIQLAYNDPAGVTRAFIFNGLHHCKRLLEQSMQHSEAQEARQYIENGISNQQQQSSKQFAVKPEDFEYFCLYNIDLGRHEAYYQAKCNTSILLPQQAAASVSSGNGNGNYAPADGSQAPPTAESSAVVVLPIRARELIHVEYSYKYNHDEVQQLAAAAGLVWCKAWPDSKQQYDLHLFTRE